jgi:hypothetical protein
LEYEFPAGTTLAPRGFVCVVRDVVAFRAAYGASPVVVGPWTGTLGGLGDQLRLLAPDGAVRDEVRYGSTPPWPIAAAGGGASLQLIAPDLDNRRPGNWSATTVFSGPQTLVTFTNEWRYFQTGERFDATTAHRLGLVHEIVEEDQLEAKAQTVLAELALNGPKAMADAKALVRYVADAPVTPELVAGTVDRIVATRSGAEGKEGVAAFLEKRTPSFRVGAQGA